MAVVPMQKVAILAHKSLREDLLEVLHKEGVLEIREAKDPVNIDHTEVNFRAAELTFAIDTLKEFAPKEAIEAARKPASEKDIVKAAQNTDVRGIVEELHKLEEQDTEAERALQEAQTLLTTLEAWRSLPYDLTYAQETKSAVRIYGTAPSAQLASLIEKLQIELPRATLEQVGTQKTDSNCVAIVWKEDRQRFEELSTQYGWSEIELPSMEGTPAAILEELQLITKKMSQIKEQNRKHRAQLAVELPNLTKVACFFRWLNEKQGVREAMNETESTFTLLGWAPRKIVARLETHLQKLSPAIAVLKVKPDEGEDPPVLLKNRKAIIPFQSVTSLYGLPLSREWDPTPALSPFFILYFALCLTDSGYGFVLATIFGIAIWKYKVPVERSPLLWCLFVSGIMAFIVGIPFGGWFGLQPEKMPAILSWTTKANGTLFVGQVWNLNAQSGVQFLQNLSLVLGITHLMFGMYLAGAYKWVHGQRMRAIWEDFTSHLLIGGGIFLAVAPENMTTLATYTMYTIIALAVWGKGYGNVWYIRPIMGVLGLVNFAISMLSNSLSYLRILALGLVTGALAMAVNQVAVELGNLFPIWLAIPIIILICVVGHLVSIALNTLGSFIHSARLQFIEFFSQFFEGGGEPFTPFTRSTS